MVALIISQTLNISLSADLTGDGVDDEVKVGEKSVIIIDGAQGKRYIPLKGIKILGYELVPTKERYVLAVLTLHEDEIVAEAMVIGFSNGNFVILNSLKWELGRTGVKFASFETLEDKCSGNKVLTVDVGSPIALLSEKLEFIEPDDNDELRDEVYLGAGESRYISPLIRKGESLFLSVILENYDIRLRIDAGECRIFDEGRVSYYRGFFYNGGDHDERFRITFDNSYSIFTSKEVRYTIIKFKSPPHLFNK